MNRFALPALCAVAALGFSLAASAQTYKVDPVHSSINFRIKHADVGYVYGRFNEFAGEFALDGADPTRSSFSFEVKADSVDTHQDKRDAHLKSPDFLNAKEFATITFKSTSVKKGADGKLEVTGDLTLHGVTKSVMVPVELTGKGEFPKGTPRAGIEAVFEIKQSDFAMKAMPGMLADNLRLTVAVEGTQQK